MQVLEITIFFPKKMLRDFDIVNGRAHDVEVAVYRALSSALEPLYRAGHPLKIEVESCFTDDEEAKIQIVYDNQLVRAPEIEAIVKKMINKHRLKKILKNSSS